MTPAELKTYISNQLIVPVNLVSKLINALFAIVDFSSTSNTDIIPTWTNALTFNTDGTGDGKYCKYADTDGNIRIFETLLDGNINNEPPTNPTIHDTIYWQEISSSAGSALFEWAAGIFGEGLIIVYWDHSQDGKGLYLLTAGTRPFSSTDIETEVVAGNWERITRPHPKFISIDTTAAPIVIDMRLLKERLFIGSANIAGNKTWSLSNSGNAVKFRLRFSSSAGVDHTFPSTFKMANAQWDPSTYKWHCYDAGEYEAEATFDGSWHLKIEGPYL